MPFAALSFRDNNEGAMRIESIIAPDRTVSLPRRSIFLILIGAAVAYIMIVPALIAHVSAWIFQHIYFRILDIPPVKLHDHMVLDRWRLKHLNWIQRLNCAYCDYINGLASWLKAVVNRTEIYSCAIKHGSYRNGQEHQKNYAGLE